MFFFLFNMQNKGFEIHTRKCISPLFKGPLYCFVKFVRTCVTGILKP